MAKMNYDARKAHMLLHNLGTGPHYRGYQIVISSLDCIASDEKCLTAFHKEICIPVSEELSCGHATVESEIRRASERAWQCNPVLLLEIAGKQLNHRPSVIQFLEMLYYSCCDMQTEKQT